MDDQEHYLPPPQKDYSAAAEKIRAAYRNQAYDNLERAGGGNGDRRARERALLEQISLGNVSLCDQLIQEVSSRRQALLVGTMSENALRQARYTVIAAVTMFTRQALDCGVSENLAYSISDTFIRYADRSQDPDEVYFLFFQALREYCAAVQDRRLQDTRPELRLCCEYIASHLHDRIRLEELSRISYLSPNYLSALFEQQLGMRPARYIRQEKLRYAAYLLKNTETPVSGIAALLAFPSPSAFAQQFRQQFGSTPAQYRRAG